MTIVFLEFMVFNFWWVVLSLCTGCICVVTYLGIYWLNVVFIMIMVWFLSMWGTMLLAHKILPHVKVHNLISNHLNFDYQKNTWYNTSCVDSLAADVDKYCISNWYPKISKDTHFESDSVNVVRNTLKDILASQTTSQSRIFLYGSLSIYLRHLKEFKRSLEKSKDSGVPVIDVYRYVHVCSNSPEKRDYFLYQLTLNFLNRFINWELRNSLPCHIVNSIVARKLINYIVIYFATPKYINYYLMKLCGLQQHLSHYTCVNLIDEEFKAEPLEVNGKAKKNNNKTPVEPLVESQNANESPIEPQNVSSAVKNVTTVTSNEDTTNHREEKPPEALVIHEDVVSPKQIIHPQVTQKEVVYSSKHSWNLGKSTETKCSTDKLESRASHNKDKLLSGMSDMGTKKLLNDVRSSIKPLSGATMNTFQSIKDLHHSTFDSVVKPVSQVTTSALHKIGDLQDEAADVVEGIIDFGKAGIRKGLLQLSSLQDQPPPRSDIFRHGHEPEMSYDMLNIREKVLLPHSEAHDEEKAGLKSADDTQQLVESNDDIFETRKEFKHPKFLPVISMDLLEGTDSPDPEYEETADLATSIAKLRSLLQQKSSESSVSTPAVSPMPTDEASTIHPDSLESDSVSYTAEDNGVMPSFYKLCAKTATGVLHNTINTLKTALPGNTVDGEYLNTYCWKYVEMENSDSLLASMNKLLAERKVFCTVDNAYEAIESLKEADEHVFPCVLQIEDDLDELDTKIPASKLLVDIICELLSETDSIWIQEPIVKLFLSICGQWMEKRVIENFEFYFNKWLNSYRYSPYKTPEFCMDIKLDEFVEMLLNTLPGVLVYVIGRDALARAIRLFISSLQFQRINDDIMLQISELVCLSFEEKRGD